MKTPQDPNRYPKGLTRRKVQTLIDHCEHQTDAFDARQLGEMETRMLRVLAGHEEFPLPEDSDIGRIARTYYAWRGEEDAGEYEDVAGFCKSATLDDIKKHGHVLTPGRYVGAADTSAQPNLKTTANRSTKRCND